MWLRFNITTLTRRISVGDSHFIGPDTWVGSAAYVAIGRRVPISHGCNIMDSITHALDLTARYESFRAILLGGHTTALDLYEKPVVIGDDAWIAAGATVLRGVTIGNGAMVAAVSVVTSDVPPMTVVAGNPAKVVRTLGSVG